VSNEELRRLLVDAVPQAPAPADRWHRIGARVRRRRNVRAGTSVALAVVAVLGLATGVVRALPAAQQRPAVESPSTGRDGIQPAPGTGSASASPVPPAPVPPPAAPPGVAFDPSKIPPGVPGSGVERVENTGEMPTPTGDMDGIFRTVCQYAQMNTGDPLGRAGQSARTPLHTYWGNTSVNGPVTKSLTGAGNSTCRGGTVDRSAYWVPAVIDTKTHTPIAPDLVHVFFDSSFFVGPTQMQPMPAGLRMLAGNPAATGPQDHARWSCWENSRGTATIPASCPGGAQVAMELTFPQCWDGHNLDSADHMSHLAYPIEGQGCPKSHPVAIPEISYHVLYTVPAGGNTSGWRLATDTYDAGKPGGYSVNGGWINGWKPDIESAWIAGCVRKAMTCGSHMLGDGRVLDGDK
jgi:hypothetical protein